MIPNNNVLVAIVDVWLTSYVPELTSPGVLSTFYNTHISPE